jgi:hypothetical protein
MNALSRTRFCAERERENWSFLCFLYFYNLLSIIFFAHLRFFFSSSSPPLHVYLPTWKYSLFLAKLDVSKEYAFGTRYIIVFFRRPFPFSVSSHFEIIIVVEVGNVRRPLSLSLSLALASTWRTADVSSLPLCFALSLSLSLSLFFTSLRHSHILDCLCVKTLAQVVSQSVSQSVSRSNNQQQQKKK